MAKTKKNRSLVLDRAETRAAAMSSIADPLELGGVLTLAAYRDVITDARGKLNRYNMLLSEADEARSQFILAERTVGDWSERMLAGVASQYGKTSDEYEKAGGARKGGPRKPMRNETDSENPPEASAA